MIIAISSSIKGGIVSPLAYTIPAPYTSPYLSSPIIGRSAPYVANQYFARSVGAPAIVKSAPYFAAAPAPVARAFVPAPAQLVSAKTILPVGAPVIKTIESDEYPQYQFAYSVNDALTGDNKAHVEQRDGDIVKGHYSLLEADGTTRKVSYYGEFQTN